MSNFIELKNKLRWQDILHPFWKRAPLAVRRTLLWLAVPKFLVGVAAICLNSKNQMLLLEHRFHNEYPWGLPGGWVDRGEAPVTTALREVREETGLEPFDPVLVHTTGDGSWIEIVYACRVKDGVPTIQTSELSDYCWVDPRDFDLQLTPNQAAAVAAFVRGEKTMSF